MGAVTSAALYLPILIGEGMFFLPRGLPLLTIAVSGVTQFFGLQFMFETVRRSEVSKAMPVIVSLQPVFSLLLSLALPLLLPFSPEPLTGRRLAGIGLVIAGSYLLSQAGGKRSRFDAGTWLYILLAGFFLALSGVCADAAYTAFESAYLSPGAGAGAKNLMFAKAFLWGRWFALAGGAVYVAATRNFRALHRGRAEGAQAQGRLAAGGTGASRRGWVVLVFLFGQGCGALAVVLQQYAIKLGNVVTVSALNGVQFFFMIALSALLSRFVPRLLLEASSRRTLLQKIVWSAVLFGGIVLLVV